MKRHAISLQWLKDRVIESGAEHWARPVWMTVTGKRLSRTDAELSAVAARVLASNSICIDIGAHKGLILDILVKYAPHGTFHAFEPLPYLAMLLRRKYRRASRVTVYDIALSDFSGTTEFYINNDAMGLSSLSAPSIGASEREGIEISIVPIAKLDDILPDARPDLIKIDVEGAELQVLRGASGMLARSHPVLAFEHGAVAKRFETKPGQVFDFLKDLGYHVSLMSRYLASDPPLSHGEFCDHCETGSNWFFLAYTNRP